MDHGRHAIASASYRKSSYSNNSNACVTVALSGGLAGVQDSKMPVAQRAADTLIVPAAELGALLRDVKAGRFDH